MNPIREWQELRDRETMNGGYPSVCILGAHDYARLCGAILAVNGLESFGTTDDTEFEGIRLFVSQSKKEGIMFG